MKIFILGATGYIGGSLAFTLNQLGHSVSGLVRNKEKAQELSKLGIEPILGSLDDFECISKESSKSDIIINAASTLHLNAAKAIIAGAKPFSTKVIHTSGIGLVSEDTLGERSIKPIQDDMHLVTPGSHQMQNLLKEVENIFVEASKKGIHTNIISNALIYGKGLGIKTTSTQIPIIIHSAKKNGVVNIVGKGENRWSVIHIKDVVSLYLDVINNAPSGHFYFAENGNNSFLEIGQAISKKIGVKIKNNTLEEANTIYGEMVARHLLGSNSVVKGIRALNELDWKPSQKSIISWIENDM